MDDNGKEMEIGDDDRLVLTPKGFWTAVLMDYGISFDEVGVLWSAFEGWALRMLKADDCDASYAAIVLDGNGGEIVGAEQKNDEFDAA